MTQVQKMIKYGALALAFFIIFSIVAGIMQMLLLFTNVFSQDDSVMNKLEELKITEASFLDIDVSSANIIIKSGQSLKAETNNKYLFVEQKDNKLFIKEKKHNIFTSNNNSELIIYVPTDFIFDGVSIESGAGQINIEKLSTKILDFDLGAGKVEIANLYVTEETSIDGGAGSILISNGELNNLELDMGVGKLDMTSKINGKSSIDAGLGKLQLNLIGNDYKIKIEKGIGSATINSENIESNKYYGNGDSFIDIDGGIGSIEVKYG